MTWITGNTAGVNDGNFMDLDAKMTFLELDGYDVDFNVIYMDDHANMEVEVYINEILVGMAHHFDDIDQIIDTYFEEGADN